MKPPQTHTLIHKEKQGKYEFVVVLILMFLSGSPVVGYFRKPLLIFFCIVFAAMCLFYRKRLNIRLLYVILCLYSLIFIVQIIQFDLFIPVFSYMGFFSTVCVAFFVVSFVMDFPKIYVKVLFFLSILSMFFMLPVWLGFGIPSLLRFIGNHLPVDDPVGRLATFFHTYTFNEKTGVYRNTGVFGEPGYFACYLNIAIFFLGINKYKYKPKKYKIYLAILICALLSTRSTQGYLVLPIAMLYHLPQPKTIKFQIALIPALILFTSVAFYVYNKLPFLKEKLQREITVVQAEQDGWRILRLGELVVAKQYIEKKPFVGWGLNKKTRYMLTPRMDGSTMSNGFVAHVCEVGVLGFLIAFIAILYAFYRYNNYLKLRCITYGIFLLLLLQGMVLFGFPMVFSLMFIKPGILHVQELEPAGV